jgi:hypothetical protein
LAFFVYKKIILCILKLFKMSIPTWNFSPWKKDSPSPRKSFTPKVKTPEPQSPYRFDLEEMYPSAQTQSPLSDIIYFFDSYADYQSSIATKRPKVKKTLFQSSPKRKKIQVKKSRSTPRKETSQTQSYKTSPSQTQSYKTSPSQTQSYKTSPSQTQPYITTPKKQSPTQLSQTQPYITTPKKQSPTQLSETQPYITTPIKTTSSSLSQTQRYTASPFTPSKSRFRFNLND